MKHQCANTRCNNKVSRPGEYCPECKSRTQLQPLYIDQHTENRHWWERREKGERKHGRSEDA